MLTDDLKFALRGIRRDPFYSLAVIATLALTLGAATAVFSIVNGVLLRPLDYRAPAQLVSIREIVPKWAQQYPTLPANARHFEEWRTRGQSFAAVAALDWRTTNIAGAGEPFQAGILRASGTLFDVLQTPVALGRPLTRDDERTDRPRVALITDAMWRDHFARDPAVLGRPLTLGGTEYTIVGILPPRFAVPAFDVLGDAATLRSKFSAVIPFRWNLANMAWMGTFNYPVIARLQPGVSIEQARAEFDVLQKSIAEIARREAHEDVELRGQLTRLDEAIVGRARLGLLLLLGAIAGVLLIACANLANLSLTRTLGRLRDAAVRSALGASRARLIGSIVLEQLLLAIAAGAAALLVAREGLVLFVRTAPIDLPRVDDVVIDTRVLLFSAAAAVGAGLIVALLPAWRLASSDIQALIRDGGRGSSDRGGVGARAWLLGVQVALSVMLLAVTGLFTTSLMRILRVDPGFSTANVISMEIAPVGVRYPDVAERASLYDRIAERARELPGVVSVAWTSALPLTGQTWVDAIGHVDDAAGVEKPSANYRFVGPDYFRTLAMPILKGRSIEERDRTRPVTPAVLSARAAQTLFPGQDPIGKPFTRSNPNVRFEVVGVVVDGHPTALDTDAPLMVYVPYWFENEGKSVLMARTAASAASVAGALRGVVRAVDPEVAVGEIAPLDAVVDRAIAGRRYQTSLFIAFGIVALLIATMGVYATTAYGVSRRRREMNIRVALGAPLSGVFAMMVRQTAVPLAAGVVAGAAGALAIGSVVAGLLYQVTPRSPAIMAGAMMLLGTAGLAAAMVAAKRGLQIDPASALREE